MREVERWSIFELGLESGVDGKNPFLDMPVDGRFTHEESGCSLDVAGFYDGEGLFRLRFMPESDGHYTYCTKSPVPALDGITGSFVCSPAQEGNNGPVRVAKEQHFSHADGTPFFVMGSTAYAWTYRPGEVRSRTLASFSAYGFNKVRMLVFPKRYIGSFNAVDISYEPPEYPFTGTPGRFDFTRFNPAYFRNFEDRVRDLMDRGIQADVILFHPYDAGNHWGINSGMSRKNQFDYLRYLLARLSAFRNVWWSLANEYDIVKTSDGRLGVGRHAKDWDSLGEYIHANDPHRHLISIHNITFGYIYPDRHWMTHVSYQHPDTYTLLLELKERYRKPVVDDEYQYEGNIPDEWGNSDAETTLLRHWLSAMAGGYATHGEVFVTAENKRDVFWAYGGTMTGQSAPRLKFMKELFESLPYQEMSRDSLNTDGQNYFSIGKGMDVYLIFCRRSMPGKGIWYGPYDGSAAQYSAKTYDVWNCREIGNKIVGLRHPFGIKEWTALVLTRLDTVREGIPGNERTPQLTCEASFVL